MWTSRLFLLQQASRVGRLSAARHASTATSTTASSTKSATAKRSSLLADTTTEASPSQFNSRLSAVHLTSVYLATGANLANLEYSLPTLSNPCPRTCPDSARTAVPKTLVVPERAEIADPVSHRAPVQEPSRAPEVHCTNRLIRIRKRKIKVHHRKKRFKKNMASYKKKWRNRAATSEVTFRVHELGKIKAAQKFEPMDYIEKSLKELHTELVPKTYKGQRHPEWFIKELMEKEKLEEEVAARRKRDLITKEPLVRDGETVEQFVQRMEEQRAPKL